MSRIDDIKECYESHHRLGGPDEAIYMVEHDVPWLIARVEGLAGALADAREQTKYMADENADPMTLAHVARNRLGNIARLCEAQLRELEGDDGNSPETPDGSEGDDDEQGH